MSENNILGVVLAGGKSKRFGEDKSTIKLNDKTLIEHTLDKIKSKLNKIIISYFCFNISLSSQLSWSCNFVPF